MWKKKNYPRGVNRQSVNGGGKKKIFSSVREGRWTADLMYGGGENRGGGEGDGRGILRGERGAKTQGG